MALYVSRCRNTRSTIPYVSQGLKGGKKFYHSSKLDFLALKWAIIKQFNEYLQYLQQPIDLHHDHPKPKVTTLALYLMTIEYLRGADNKVTDILVHISERFDAETVKELMNHVTHSSFSRKD